MRCAVSMRCVWSECAMSVSCAICGHRVPCAVNMLQVQSAGAMCGQCVSCVFRVVPCAVSVCCVQSVCVVYRVQPAQCHGLCAVSMCHTMLRSALPQLHGYMEKDPLTLQLFIGTADERLLRPHAFYQVHRITGKTVSTTSHEALMSNTKVLEIPLLPENHMRAM